MPGIGYDFKDAGAHWHDALVMGKSFHGGRHMHLMDDMKTVLMEGEHVHDIDVDKSKIPGKMGWSGPHTHKVIFPDGTIGFTKPLESEITPGAGPTEENMSNGRHQHEYTADNEMSRGGQHMHTIEMPDGTVRKTLGHNEIKMLVEKGEKLPQSLFDDVL